MNILNFEAFFNFLVKLTTYIISYWWTDLFNLKQISIQYECTLYNVS